jgi:hypothetical protein
MGAYRAVTELLKDVRVWAWSLTLIAPAWTSMRLTRAPGWAVALACWFALMAYPAIVAFSRYSKEKIEEKQRRRDQIGKWRHMLAHVVVLQGRHPPAAAPIDFVYSLHQQPDFFGLQPRLEPVQWGKYTATIEGSRLPSVLDFIRDEITRLEREWRL